MPLVPDRARSELARLATPRVLPRRLASDGWRPFPTAASAIAYIDALIEAGPLCDYQDEHGYQSCWV